MSLHELHNNVTYRRGLSPAAAVTDNTAFVSEIIDMQGFTACEFVLLSGSIADADATFTVLLEEGSASDLTGGTAVADDDMNGTEVLAAHLFSDDDTIKKLGYKGAERYVRLTVTPAANTGNIFLACIVAMFPPAGRHAGI